jgi:hypothetical protein
MVNKSFLEVYSAIATAFSVVTPIVAYRLAGPRVSVRARIVTISEKNYLSVEINNNGRSAVTVDILGIKLFYFYGDHQIREHFVKLQFDGADLPARIEGDSFDTWKAPADFLSTFVDLHDTSNSMQLALKIGGRRKRRVRRIKIAASIIVDATGRPM